MQKLAEIRGQLKSVDGIRQVCGTMAIVSSAKLSRVRNRALGLRTYVAGIRDILEQQRAAHEFQTKYVLKNISPMMQEVTGKRVLLVALSADRGLCGGYNQAISRRALAFAVGKSTDGASVEIVAIGSKIDRYLRRRSDCEMQPAWFWPSEGLTPLFISAVQTHLLNTFLSGAADEVWCAYTAFVSPVQHEPRMIRLLPLSAPERAGEQSLRRVQWFYEPERRCAVLEVVERLAEAQIEDVLVESYASEQSARMVTMEEASERADKMLAELRVRVNRVRREAVTADLLGVLMTKRVGKGATADGTHHRTSH